MSYHPLNCAGTTSVLWIMTEKRVWFKNKYLAGFFRGDAKSPDSVHSVAAKQLLWSQGVTRYQVGKGMCCRSEGGRDALLLTTKPPPHVEAVLHPPLLSSPFPALSFPPTVRAPVLCRHEQFCDCWARRLTQLKNDFAKRCVIFHPSKYSGPGHPMLHKCLRWHNWWARPEAEANAEDGVGRKYGLTVLLVAMWKCT